ncbi:MAG: hypothetical protein JWQ28_1167 [Pedobacter sp.]|jgi:hypothetical protein|nr:hypothetical protein [Pedobacter sp.]
MKRLPLPALCALLVLQLCLSSCTDDDLKKAATISDKTVAFNANRTYGAEVIYSDSAKVKAKGFAPILDKVTGKKGVNYQEMPKGVKIDFFDQNLHSSGTITSDYAIMKETEQLTIFRKHVVVVNANLTFNTEELVWNQNKKTFSSPKGIITKPDGTVINAINFKAPEDFSSVDFENAYGETYIKGDLEQ